MENTKRPTVIYIQVDRYAAGAVQELAEQRGNTREEMAGEAALYALENLHLWTTIRRGEASWAPVGEPFEFTPSDTIIRRAYDIAEGRGPAISTADVIRRAVHHGTMSLWLNSYARPSVWKRKQRPLKSKTEHEYLNTKNTKVQGKGVRNKQAEQHKTRTQGRKQVPKQSSAPEEITWAEGWGLWWGIVATLLQVAAVGSIFPVYLVPSLVAGTGMLMYSEPATTERTKFLRGLGRGLCASCAVIMPVGSFACLAE